MDHMRQQVTMKIIPFDALYKDTMKLPTFMYKRNIHVIARTR